MNKRKLLKKIISGSKNVRFGFRLDRIKGSHHIYLHVKGKARPYQVKQFFAIIEKYDL